MTFKTITVAMIGGLATFSVHAQSSIGSAGNLLPASQEVSSPAPLSSSDALVERLQSVSYDLPEPRPSVGFGLGKEGKTFGFARVADEVGGGATGSSLDRFYRLGAVDATPLGSFDGSSRIDGRVIGLAYSWRGMTVEGSTVTLQDKNPEQGYREAFRAEATTGKVLYRPSSAWMVQLTRGSINGLDQLDPNGTIKRTTLGATYREHFAIGLWQTTFAWGRNVRRNQEASTGYLVESMLKMNPVQALFGRIEQVGSDDIARENESVQRQSFRMNKLTLGYIHELPPAASVRREAGAMMIRHMVPTSMSDSYGEDRNTFQLFLRLRFR